MRRRRANEPALLPRDEHEAPGQGGPDHRSAGNAAMARLLQGTVFRQATAPVQEEDALGPEMSAAIAAERGRGASLPEPVRADMEHRLGSDFSGVRVHHDRQADTLNHALAAEAFTTGTDIFFSGGSYNPTSSAGRELLAHELTHVAQQNTGAVSLSPRASQPAPRRSRPRSPTSVRCCRSRRWSTCGSPRPRPACWPVRTPSERCGWWTRCAAACRRSAVATTTPTSSTPR